MQLLHSYACLPAHTTHLADRQPELETHRSAGSAIESAHCTFGPRCLFLVLKLLMRWQTYNLFSLSCSLAMWGTGRVRVATNDNKKREADTMESCCNKLSDIPWSPVYASVRGVVYSLRVGREHAVAVERLPWKPRVALSASQLSKRLCVDCCATLHAFTPLFILHQPRL